ncbi:hypothetical protein AGLY_003723 [Aphis glycines]|uniref:Uncharacterized protein n=1 Tax=Aphis glycines TaxID=307491 RepID=A0A6G0TZ58_APHGL|nr:hypothetical protein AGLY_003723 [Aphis glycines]
MNVSFQSPLCLSFFSGLSGLSVGDGLFSLANELLFQQFMDLDSLDPLEFFLSSVPIALSWSFFLKLLISMYLLESLVRECSSALLILSAIAIFNIFSSSLSSLALANTALIGSELAILLPVPYVHTNSSMLIILLSFLGLRLDLVYSKDLCDIIINIYIPFCNIVLPFHYGRISKSEDFKYTLAWWRTVCKSMGNRTPMKIRRSAVGDNLKNCDVDGGDKRTVH